MTKRVVIARPDYKRITKAVVEWENRSTDLTETKKKAPAKARTIRMIQITGLHPDSPSTGFVMHVGTIYKGEDSYREDVSVRIDGVRDSSTLPSYGSWENIPRCIGMPRRVTWEGETETHQEVVYYALGLMILV